MGKPSNKRMKAKNQMNEEKKNNKKTEDCRKLSQEKEKGICHHLTDH